MLSRINTFQNVLVLVATVLFVVAFFVSLGWFSGHLHNASAWGFAGLATFASSFLPWRA